MECLHNQWEQEAQNGIINNRLYIGKIVYNRQRFIKDPVTGRRQARPNLPSEWLEQEVPELAILPFELFEAAQRRRSRYSAARLSHRPASKHLLSGLVHCGCCGASMIIVRDDRVGCSARMNKMTCDNRRTISLAEIEARILKVLQEHLLTPDVVASAVEKYRVERERLAKGRAKTRRAAERELAAVMRKISGVITAIEFWRRSSLAGAADQRAGGGAARDRGAIALTRRGRGAHSASEGRGAL